MLDYDRLKAIPLDSVLSHYGCQLKGSGAQLKSECPLPSHPKSQHRNSFAVNLEKRKFMCHDSKCNGNRGGDVIDLVRLLDNCDVKDACRKLAELYPQNKNAPLSNGTSPIKTDAVVIPDNHTAAPKENKPLGWRFEDEVLDFTHPMIQARGISEETARLFRIGAYIGKGKTMAGRIVFELRETEVCGYAGRSISDELPKWLLPKGFNKFCYGLDRCTPDKILIVGESFWLPPFMYEKSWQACSLMGKELTERMEKELEPYKEIILALDGDEAGRVAREKVAARLKERGHKVIKSSLLE